MKIDWSRTTAWGSGGYYGRLFLNVKGREPQGLIAPDDYEATRDRLIAELEALGDPEGRPIGTRVLKPEQLYRTIRGAAPPDLFVYFGDLRWRSVGHRRDRSDPHVRERHRPRRRQPRPRWPADRDRARHRARRGRCAGMQLMDVTPTILRLFGLEVPADLQGNVLEALESQCADPPDPPCKGESCASVATSYSAPCEGGAGGVPSA